MHATLACLKPLTAAFWTFLATLLLWQPPEKRPLTQETLFLEEFHTSLENLFQNLQKAQFYDTQENAGWETGGGWNEIGTRRKEKEALKNRGRGKTAEKEMR